MRHIPLSDAPPRAIVVAGSVSEEHLRLVCDLLCLHSACFGLSALGEVVKSLGSLRDYSESIKVSDNGGMTDGHRAAWEKILKIELGRSLLRAAAKSSVATPQQVLVIPAGDLPDADLFFSFFPVTPLIIVSSDESAEVEGEVRRIRKLGYPMTCLALTRLFSNRSREMTRLLDFAMLPIKEYSWDYLNRKTDGPWNQTSAQSPG